MAGTILAISAAVMSTSVSLSLRSVRMAGDFEHAAELLDRTLTKVDMIGPYRLSLEGPTDGQFLPPDERFSWSLDIEMGSIGSLYEVTATVRWDDGGTEREVSATTLLNDPFGSRGDTLLWEDL